MDNDLKLWTPPSEVFLKDQLDKMYEDYNKLERRNAQLHEALKKAKEKIVELEYQLNRPTKEG